MHRSCILREARRKTDRDLVSAVVSFGEGEEKRPELPPHAYLWINAYKSRPDDYREEDLARLERAQCSSGSRPVGSAAPARERAISTPPARLPRERRSGPVVVGAVNPVLTR
jgi:hypothetical protein